MRHIADHLWMASSLHVYNTVKMGRADDPVATLPVLNVSWDRQLLCNIASELMWLQLYVLY